MMVEEPMPDQALVYGLVDLTIALAGQTNAVIAELLGKLDLTPSQADALWQLDPDMAGPPMRELAVRLRCDPSTVTTLVDRLEEKNMVKRRIDPTNRRVKTLLLSSKGRAVRRKLVDAMTTLSPMARLSADEQQLLHKLLSKAVSAGRASVPHLPLRPDDARSHSGDDAKNRAKPALRSA